MLKKMVTVMLVLAMMASLSVSAGLAAKKATEEPGQGVKKESRYRGYPKEYESVAAAAKAEVPPDALLQDFMDDKDTVLFSFYDNNTLHSYEVVVLKSVDRVKEVRIVGSNIPGSVTVSKTAEDIHDIVLQEYPDAQNIEIGLKKEGNLSYYEAAFETVKFIKADIKVNPVTGAIGSRKLLYKPGTPQAKYVKPVNEPSQVKEEKPVVNHSRIPPVSADWTCTSCGTVNHEGQFCTNCGAQRQAEAASFKCSKCGWTPKDPDERPNFCPQCGKRLN